MIPQQLEKRYPLFFVSLVSGWFVAAKYKLYHFKFTIVRSIILTHLKAMEIKPLQINLVISSNKKLSEKYESFQKLISELNKKAIPVEIANSINKDIEEIN